MAKVVVQFTCSECGTTTGRWLGRCPGCASFGTLVEELTSRESAKGRAASAGDAKPLLRLAEVDGDDGVDLWGVPEREEQQS